MIPHFDDSYELPTTFCFEKSSCRLSLRNEQHPPSAISFYISEKLLVNMDVVNLNKLGGLAVVLLY